MNDSKTASDLMQCIDFWKKTQVYKSWQDRNAQNFVLYDGPPYANGDIHLGHALNKILKDAINRFKALQGYRVVFIPAWDCHGLPIEVKVETEFKKQGLHRKNISPAQMVTACKEYAKYYIDRQRADFLKLGVVMHDEACYTTMDQENEIIVVKFIHKIARDGLLVRKLRPVLWSCEEGTALADAEIEYANKQTKTVDVLMEVTQTDIKDLEGGYVAIWTTTAWTLPANRAIAYNKNYEYCLLESEGKKILILKDLVGSFVKRCKIKHWRIIQSIDGEKLQNTKFAHPLDSERRLQPLVASDHVTNDSGTGFVHISPDHGLEDFIVAQEYGLECCDYVNHDGRFKDEVPKDLHFLTGCFYADSIDKIITMLANRIMCVDNIVHSYPHSWRSKKPVIFRATNQWFIEIERADHNLKQMVMKATERVKWHPDFSVNRFTSTVNSRESWCISRQRFWGIPMCLFHKEGKIQIDMLDACLEFVQKNGVYAWYGNVGIDNPNNCEKVADIVDVWIESGLVGQYFKAITNISQADLLLEGSDQHRCWFQALMYCGLILNNKEPMKMIATHGFVVDSEGKKMSKSKSNGLSPQEIVEQFGLECLRLWVLTKDYTQELKIAKNHFETLQKVEQKIKNTLKFLLTNAKKCEGVQYADYSPLDRWILASLCKMQKNMSDYTKTITSLSSLFTDIHNFCVHNLSKIYFDAIKDSLYFDPPTSLRRQAIQNTLHHVLNFLLHWIAPFMPITAEKSWQSYAGSNWMGGSVHVNLFPDVEGEWNNAEAWENVETIIKLREKINQKVEEIRSVDIKNANCCRVSIGIGENKILKDSAYVETLQTVCGVAELITKEGDWNIENVEGVEFKKCTKCNKKKKDVDNELCARCSRVINESGPISIGK